MVARKAAPRKATGTRRAAPAKAATRTRRPAEDAIEETTTARRTRRTRANSTSRGNAAPAKRTAAKAAPAKAQRDVTQYADKEPTAYHKAFATWLVREVGVKLNGLTPKEAFLMGVSTATAARNSFMDSDFLEEWREKNNVAKRGPKADTRRSNRAVVTDEEFEPEADEADDDDADDDGDGFEEDDDFDSDDESDEDSEEDEEIDEDDDFEDEPEPAPVARKRTAAKATGRRTKAAPADDDDGMLF